MLPLLDTLSNGVGAAVLLFLVFTIAGAPAASPQLAVRNTIMVEIEVEPRDLLVAWIDAPAEAGSSNAQPIPLYRRVRDGSVTDTHELFRDLGPARLSGFAFVDASMLSRIVHLEVTTALNLCWRFRFARIDRDNHWAVDTQLPGRATISVHGGQTQDIELRSVIPSTPMCVMLGPSGDTRTCDCPS